MIHYWECIRCTHQWQSSCFDDFTRNEEEKENHSRQLWSDLCPDCFELLESEQISGLALFELYFYLRRKSEEYGASQTWRVFNIGTTDSPFYNHQKFSGMCREYVSATYNEDGSEKTPSNFEWGQTAEHKQLREITCDVEDAYKQAILAQRTLKRIELDAFQSKDTKENGIVWFGPRRRPDGFEGDPPGKQRFTTLFGFDPASGNFLAPCIIAEDGTGENNEQASESD